VTELPAATGSSRDGLGVHTQAPEGNHDVYADDHEAEDDSAAEFLCRACATRLWDPLLQYYPDLWAPAPAEAEDGPTRCPRSTTAAHPVTESSQTRHAGGWGGGNQRVQGIAAAFSFPGPSPGLGRSGVALCGICDPAFATAGCVRYAAG
jgi:hypothetical protein